MPELVRRFEAQSPGPSIVVTYGGSGALRRQVEAGAPLDAVVLAGAGPVDELIDADLADGATRQVRAHNELVLVVPKGGADVTFETLERLPAGERIAIGDPDGVPVGRYARDALLALDQWERLRDRFVHAPHVAAVLSYVRRGEAGAAIVYRTDVRGIEDVVIRDFGRAPWAPTPEVVAAVIEGGNVERAGALLRFAASEEGSALLRSYGFVAERS